MINIFIRALISGFKTFISQTLASGQKLAFTIMGKITQPSEKVSVDINVNVTYDENGLPTGATGQKELTEESGGEGEETADTLVILPGTASKLASDLSADKTAYDNAIAEAKAAFEAQLVADNYVNGVFTAPTQS